MAQTNNVETCKYIAETAQDKCHADAEVHFSPKRNAYFWSLPDGQYLYDVNEEVPAWKCIKINTILQKWDVSGKAIWNHKVATQSTLNFIRPSGEAESR